MAKAPANTGKKDNTLSISVIIRTKDRPHLLHRALTSLGKQKRPADEVIIVNDGGIAVDEVIADFPKLNVHLLNNQTSQGRSRAGNQGVSAARSNTIAFLDDDDIFLPDHLMRLATAMHNFDARVVYAGCRLIERSVLSQNGTLHERKAGEFNESYEKKRLNYENYIPLISLLIDRALWRETGGFDESFDLFEDWDVLKRLSERCTFYHVKRITSEYAVWGAGQVTRAADKERWNAAYRQFLEKHVLPLNYQERLDLLSEYWMLSQQRRSMCQQWMEQKQADLDLQRKMAEQDARYEDKEQAWQKKYSALEMQYAEAEREIAALKKQRTALYKDKTGLEERLYELAKQTAAGICKPELEKILLSRPAAYTLASSDSGGPGDFRNLLSWVEDKARLLAELERNGEAEKKAVADELQARYQNLNDELQSLKLRMSASRWKQVRRHVPVLDVIDRQAQDLLHGAGQCLQTTSKFSELTGLAYLSAMSEKADDEVPPPRPLSPLYPTFAAIAGSENNPAFMDTVQQLGTTPFMLSPGTALVFTTFCTVNGFFRLDVLMATCLRLNTCHLRLIIREWQQPEALRTAYYKGTEIFDNRYHTLNFDPLEDSAGKVYQIELDSPDARDDATLAVWCHQRMPAIHNAQTPSEDAAVHYPDEMPGWMQQGMLGLPLSPALYNPQGQHVFMLQALDQSIPPLALHVLLVRLGRALEQAGGSGRVLLCGEASYALKAYCAEQQLTVIEAADLPQILEAATQQSDENNTCIWLGHVRAIPQDDIVVQALKLFENKQTVALVPMEVQENGRIRSAYAKLLGDATILPCAHEEPADHPRHGFMRRVDAADSELLVIRRECLADLDVNAIAAYQTSLYQITELISQLRAKPADCVYSAALVYISNRNPVARDKEDFEADRVHFYHNRRTELPVQLNLYSTPEEWLNPEQQPGVLVVEATLPSYDEDSGSLRMYTLLKLWAGLGYRISYFSDNLDSGLKYRRALEALGVEVFHGEYKIAGALVHRHYDYALICRVEVGHRYIPFIRMMSPETTIWYDTVDIHYVREERQAEIEQSDVLMRQARETKHKELANCRMADKVITVTEEDGKHLQKELPYLEYAVIPNIHKHFPPPQTGFAERDGLVFIGNYNHTPNEDAVYFFVAEVLPKIRQRIPDARLYLIGSHMKDKMKQLASEAVECIGWVDEVEPEFAKRRLFVSYLRYGAGMKGKLGQALAVGLPVVSTTIGAEGMGLVHQENCLIADDPDSFAEAVYQAYTDRDLWQQLSSRGQDYIEASYGEQGALNKLQRLLNTPPAKH